MNLKKIGRICIMLVLFFILTIIIIALHIREGQLCMGIEIAPENFDIDNLQQTDVELNEYLLFNEQKVAINRGTKTIYIPQVIDEHTKINDLQGKLTINLNEYELKLLYDREYDNLYQAVKNGHKFTLLAIRGKEYVKFELVFTTLPVMRINGEYSHMVLEREVLAGDMTLWTPFDESTGRYSTKSSKLNWHIRGNTTYVTYKKSWKLSLVDSNGEKKNMEFLGLGEDDDWILNSMTYDDVKVKEKLCMDLWNNHSQKTEYNYPMSTGNYVEVVVNDEYKGLYLLQRRVDKKYLGLSENDMLIKGANRLTIENVEEGYRIEYSPFTDEDTYRILEDIFINNNYELIDADNIADINLFMEFGCMPDNVNYKNVFYVLENNDDDYTMKFILWDTDMSFGITWIDGFAHSEEKALKAHPNRSEMSKGYADINPDIYNLMAEKWQILREDVLSAENIQNCIDAYYNTLVDSGVYSRNFEEESVRYGGADTKEAMESYISQKLAIMDEKYLN